MPNNRSSDLLSLIGCIVSCVREARLSTTASWFTVAPTRPVQALSINPTHRVGPLTKSHSTSRKSRFTLAE